MAPENDSDFTHFVVPEFKRTQNMLIALAAGETPIIIFLIDSFNEDCCIHFSAS